MAKVTEHFKNAKGKTLFSIEIIPPSKGTNINELLDAIEPMMELQPPFIDVTYHREEYTFKELEDGSLQQISTRKRPGTIGICSAIKHKFDVDPVPHVLCGGFTKEDTEDLLVDLQYLGIENVVALRGDTAKPFKEFKAKKNGHNFASELIGQISNFNRGQFLYETLEKTPKGNFCIGAAAYPEKHFEAENLDVDFENLKKKVDAGAEYLVTQMFFDNQKYFDFVNKCRANGIDIPIVPGLKIISTKSQLDVLPKIFYLDIPSDLRKAIENTKDNNAAREVGIEWAIQQGKELQDFGVPALHFYTMSKSNTTMAVAKALF